MSRFIYTEPMIEFLKVTYPECSIADTARLFNYAFGTSKSEKEIKSCIKNHGIKCGRVTGSINKGKLRLFTREQFEWVEENYKQLSLPQLTEAFNLKFGTERTEKQIRSFTRNHGIKSGRTGRFEKGSDSWNKGMKGWQAGGNAKKTQFKKGNIPLNHRPVGSERVNVDGYIEIKVSEPNKWRLKHRVVWEHHNQQIQPGQMIWFRDNDPKNCSIDNLMLVTRAQHAVVNKLGLQCATQDLKETAVLLADITMAATRRKNSRCGPS
ncbi:TPA: HNH endonuclease [Shewanella algae]|uniref:HNH endonuclease signature motif containing protein n=2 Tax=Shewanella algae TaxID=38313 RepID=UPI001C5882B8|nr:HNH endonuclease signature motif containing protein [Shewanella algae]HDS1208901.1 HNH endonuclease [Shewanella algae]